MDDPATRVPGQLVGQSTDPSLNAMLRAKCLTWISITAAAAYAPGVATPISADAYDAHRHRCRIPPWRA